MTERRGAWTRPGGESTEWATGGAWCSARYWALAVGRTTISLTSTSEGWEMA